MSRELDARQFEARFRELLRRAEGREENDGCVQCVECRGCSACTFCRNGDRLVRCHYCVDCALCSDSGHCRDCRGLVNCQHCIESENCLVSSYLIRCVSLSHCTYCFGCVGLSGKDFHILNEPYARSAYFALSQRLSRELGL